MQLLTATGTPLADWGVTGSGKGKFRGPNGVAVDDLDDVHNTSGRGQVVSATTAASRSVTYDVTWQNDGVFQERLRLRGTASTARFSVRYTVGGTNVTAAVVAGGMSVLDSTRIDVVRFVTTRG